MEPLYPKFKMRTGCPPDPSHCPYPLALLLQAPIKKVRHVPQVLFYAPLPPRHWSYDDLLLKFLASDKHSEIHELQPTDLDSDVDQSHPSPQTHHNGDGLKEENSLAGEGKGTHPHPNEGHTDLDDGALSFAWSMPIFFEY
jgi:hypothetical protein